MVADEHLTEKLVMALGEALVRKGVLDADDLIEAGERSSDPDVTHALNCIVLQAAAPTLSEWTAERRRKTMRVIRPHDGGSEG